MEIHDASLTVQAVTSQPVVAVIHASADFLAYSGGIFAGSCSSAPVDGNYSVLVVAYNSQFWTVRTSMGPNWGESGYVRLAVGVNACGIDNWGSYPVTSCEFGKGTALSGRFVTSDSEVCMYTIGYC